MCPKILQTERVQWNCYCQYVSMTVNSFSQKRLIVFSWNFAWNCGVPEGSKTSGAEFLRKIITFGENSENSSKIGFLGLLKKYNMLTCFFLPQNGVQYCSFWFCEAVCLGRILFFSYSAKCSQPIRLQGSMIANQLVSFA